MLKRFFGGLAAIILVSAAVAWFQTRDSGGPRVASPADSPFDDNGALPYGPYWGRFGPDGRQLVVVSGADASLAKGGELQQLNQEGEDVLDAAWMPGGNGVLVAYGPTGSDKLAVFNLKGDTLGFITMNPVVPIASTSGMAVDSAGKRAAVTAIHRGGLPGEQPVNAVHIVDLATGATSQASPPDQSVSRPIWLSETQLLVAVSPPGRPTETRAAVLSLETKLVQPFGPEDAVTRPLAVLGQGLSVLEVRRGDTTTIEVFTPALELKRIGTLPPGWSAVHVDPTGTRALVLDTTERQRGEIRLRRLNLSRL